MTNKKQAELGNLGVVDFPDIQIVPSVNKSPSRTNQELHLIQIDDGYKPKSIYVNRSWNRNIKDRS